MNIPRSGNDRATTHTRSVVRPNVSASQSPANTESCLRCRYPSEVSESLSQVSIRVIEAEGRRLASTESPPADRSGLPDSQSQSRSRNIGAQSVRRRATMQCRWRKFHFSIGALPSLYPTNGKTSRDPGMPDWQKTGGCVACVDAPEMDLSND